jgi:hypothetical protein
MLALLRELRIHFTAMGTLEKAMPLLEKLSEISRTMIDLAAFKTLKVRQAYEYWLGKSAGGLLPRRSDIKPEELRGLLAFVFLIDVTQVPLTFAFRVVGTQLTQWAGREYTGFTFSHGDGEPNWKSVFDDYRSVVVTRLSRRDERKSPWASKESYRFERMVAPLSNYGSTVDMLFGALDVL